MSMVRGLFLLVLLCGSSLASAVTVTPELLRRLGVPDQRAQCIVRTLGEGAELDEADEVEGELDTAKMDKIRNAVVRASRVAEPMAYREIARATFRSPDSQSLFVQVAMDCRGG